MADAELTGSVFVSAISLVELFYLSEKGRISDAVAAAVVSWIADDESAAEVVPVDFDLASRLATVSRDEVPDMPDRIIGATALNVGVSLVTRDSDLQRSAVPTIWWPGERLRDHRPKALELL